VPESSQKAAEKQHCVPLFGSWRNAYLAVVAIFILEVGFFFFVSRWFL